MQTVEEKIIDECRDEEGIVDVRLMAAKIKLLLEREEEKEVELAEKSEKLRQIGNMLVARTNQLSDECEKSISAERRAESWRRIAAELMKLMNDE